ncbi:hypothetical protein SAMN02910456_00328 [Ruminococcaceae bacterium YRB3002]|nr:hypothetical protein SAMN02910456_00328 [Ruminococcaceae bacterium YRB3002]
MAEMWNQVLTRDNIVDFYNQTVTMVYPSVFDITKETTRAENAIIKSYQEIYSKRESVAAEDVIFVFGDILLKNAKDIVEQYPLPDNITFAPRLLDEYTRNSMLDKILARIDSKSFKMAEFISSDSHKQSSSQSMRKYMDVFPVTPLLVAEVILVSLIIWLVSWAAIKVPYSNDKLVDEQAIFETNSLQEKYMTAMGFYPLNPDINKSFYQKEKTAAAGYIETLDPNATTSDTGESSEESENTYPMPNTAQTSEGETEASDDSTEPSATRG